MANRTKGDKEKLSFGIEMEFFLAWRAESFTGTVPAPPGVQVNPGAPLVVRGRWENAGDRVGALALIIDEAFPSPEGAVAPLDKNAINYGDREWTHLQGYRRWSVVDDVSLRALPKELADRSDKDFGWIGAEIVSPALWATNEGFDEVRRMCDFLQRHFWIFNSHQAGLHVHVGNGNEWLPLNSLRQIAALLYAADPILAQSHPKHRYENAYCTSPRLYSNVSFGLVNPVREPVQPAPPTEVAQVERPSRYAQVITRVQNLFQHFKSHPEPSKDDKVTKKVRFPTRPATGAYNLDQDTVQGALWDLGGDYQGPHNAQSYEPVPLITAVGEILRSADRHSIARMMGIGLRRGAYSFAQLERETKRTIEFRQAASTVDPIEVVTHARIAVGLCRFAASASHNALMQVILDCEMAEGNPSWFDVYDFLSEVGLTPEAKIVQAVLSGTLTDDMRKEYWLSRNHVPRL
ncbi:putative amidoligase enzyme-domain-containing protein [Daldinia caldariorum]|uniref:putative amidoligase enzyme-domain-containing protein n=1 Tax=Daldinia caldariorum TaxID=326644 RepID=UPI0020073D14|nr:putative amidoligase enzyme-domain-containing protein [Daldinia caldariorum]KAI1466438.1 putative amidoligase enzyme-domain-containing protein [Daldinia caldariorum]